VKSSFNYYLTDHSKTLKEENTDAKQNNVMALAAAKWKTLDEEEKAPYEKLAKEDAERKAR
jgi:hypothetical protein